MTYSSVVISAGHSKHVRGAAGPTPRLLYVLARLRIAIT